MKLSKRKNFSKGTGKRNVWKKSPQEAAGHNSEPPKQTYYWESGLLMEYPLETLFGCCLLMGFLIRHRIFWDIGHFWEFKVKETKKVKKRKVPAKERKRKGENDFEIFYLQKKTGHNSEPPKQTYYWESGLLMEYPLETLFGCCLLMGFLIRHRIFWDIGHFWEFKVKETKKVKKRKVPAKERKRKGENDFEIFYLQKKTGHNSEPPKQTYYWESGLLMEYPLETLFGCCLLMGFLIRHRIFWDIGHFWEFKVKETKKVKKRKDQQRGENDFVFFTSKTKLDTIVNHQNKHTI